MPDINQNKITKAGLLISGCSMLGGVAGIYLAVKRKSGFWAGAGWFLLLGTAGTAVGYIVSSTINFDSSTATDNSTTTTN